MNSSLRPQNPQQRGAAALIVTLALSIAMLLVAAFANRNLVFEQRTSANQYRSTQAFEAAEAGLEWATAQLNNNARIGADCLPSSEVADASFRDRYLNYRPASAAFSVATWDNAGVPTPRQAACVRGETGWACSCPTSGFASLIAPSGSAPAPAFTVQFQADSQPGIVRLVAMGCTSLAGACVAGTAATSDATARIELALALVPGLKTAPGATLTSRGNVDAGAAALGLHNIDVASGGIAVHAGGSVIATQSRVSAPAGSPSNDAIAANDDTLASLDANALFASIFGMSKTAWQSQSVVKSLGCDGNCANALLSLIDEGIVNPLIHVAGDLRLDGPLVLGTPQRPIVIVADGAVQLHGAVVIHGVLYSRTLSWDDTAASGALLHGAAITEDGYSGNGSPDLSYDAEILATLRGRTGSFARVNGSWRDF